MVMERTMFKVVKKTRRKGCIVPNSGRGKIQQGKQRF